MYFLKKYLLKLPYAGFKTLGNAMWQPFRHHSRKYMYSGTTLTHPLQQQQRRTKGVSGVVGLTHDLSPIYGSS